MPRLRISILTLGCTLGLTLSASLAHAQAGYGQVGGYNPATGGGGAAAYRNTGGYQRVSGRSNPALTFFGGARAMHYASTGNSQAMPAPQPVQTAAYMKPYSGVQPPQPSISPYLALDQLESSSGVPNYYTFVKPQLDQNTMNQAQQVQYRRMQKQMRRATTAGIMPTSLSGGMPTTGHSTQFMNPGGYYPSR